ncbi:alpha-mannosidase [Cohnella zeiphila]|uniref:Alpha-mannosidase n=1 Tax=Cohnella zeiphila TaxID=2761120 RepID=A0A7X0SGG2_9BACL|nr:glycoside hydrolase family 38 C-terminal domain-containing protein [Cohnella zeiphila]MBB6729545.1 alpha-mannosidase [Cohnella zeiphila]
MINRNHVQKTLGKLRKLEDIYSGLIFEKRGEVPVRYFETQEHLYEVPGPEADWRPAERGRTWGRPWGSAWFKGTFEVPAALDGGRIYIQAQTDGVETFFWVNGKPRGIFTHPKDAENRGNHRTLLLTERARAGEAYELAFEGYAGHPCVGTQPYQSHETGDGSPIRYERIFQSIDIVQCREDVQAFVFDLRTLNQMVRARSVDDFRKAKIENALLEAFRLLPQSPEEETEDTWRSGVAAASAVLRPLLESPNSPSAPQAGLIGHSHMDTAWLWTRDETIRKCARTYANALSLMEQYPEYTFVQSSAFHAELMRRHYPDIFEGIKRRTAEGRWEPNGGVWIEMDCNLAGGESIVRQFLKGQRYTREHFGYTADTFWLPDTFGYSAAIPQIMAGSGIRYFLTTKLSWNDTNLFPLDTFRWRGMDGTTVLTHFNTIHCWPDAETVASRIYERGNNGVQHPRVNDRRLISYGFGDGGGGPQYEMLEMARRIRDTEGVPRSGHTTVSRFMQELEETSVQLPLYVGELYFEGHRGTLTQMHQIKRNNRKAEIALRSLELIEVMERVAGGGRLSPSLRTTELYELLLINQFHDILPGTSIPEVHDRAVREVGDVIREAGKTAAELLSASLRPDSRAVTVLNALSWDRAGTIELDAAAFGGMRPADPALAVQLADDVLGRKRLLIGGAAVPALGTLTIELEPDTEARTAPSPFRFAGDRLETPFAVVRFDEHGYIASFADKASGRELRGEGHPLNALLLGEDLPGAWDNWDIDRDQAGKLRLQTALVSREIAADGPLQFRIRSEYRIGNASSLKQDIVFHSDTPRVDFETAIDWNEKHRLLKAGFDVALLATCARHEIQFGHVERPTHDNTPYDQGMFEVCNHKWTDLSENRFGVALLNDCKYGISVSGSDMRLTLHKGGAHPDPRGDEGLHEVVYSLLPHEGGFSAETVVRPAYELNVPVLAASGRAPGEPRSFAEIDAANVIVESVKPAEEDDAYVIRLYEAERSAVKGARLRFGFAPSRVVLTDMLEEEKEEVDLKGSEIRLDFRAFEIKTVKVYR